MPARFVMQKILRALFTMLLVVSFVFVILRLAGDPALILLSPETPQASIDAYRRMVGLDRPQVGVEAEQGGAVGANDRALVAHIEVDVRVVMWRRDANALEFLDPNADFRDGVVVPELRIAVTTHAVCSRHAR